MAKEETIEFEGTVIEARPAGLFIVEIGEGDSRTEIKSHLSGKIRKNKIQVSIGDKVRVEMTPYDLSKGRITYRL